MPLPVTFFQWKLLFISSLVLVLVALNMVDNSPLLPSQESTEAIQVAQQALSANETKVEIGSFDWNGEIPTSRLVVIKNPYGSIRSRNHLEEKVFYHAAIQKIGEMPLEPRFDVQQKQGRLYIEVVYDQEIHDQAGQLRGRTDVSVLFPDTVSIYAETDSGLIKIDKTASHVEAVSRSGKIKLNTSGLFRVVTQSGEISLRLRGFVQHGESSAHSGSGTIKASIFDDMAVSIIAETNASVTLNSSMKPNGVVYRHGEQPLAVQLTSDTGSIILETRAPPELVNSISPSKPDTVNVDLRTLPEASPWKPGDPVYDRGDKKDYKSGEFSE